MKRSPWQRRIERAQELAKRHPHAGEMLAFYIHVARFQEQLHRSLKEVLSTQAIDRCPLLTTSALSELTSRFDAFLRVCAQHGPRKLAEISRDLQKLGAESWSELLSQTWQSFSGSTAQELLATAFLQPYAELLRSEAGKPQGGANLALCPFCGRKPGFGILRPMGEGAARWLGCTFCLSEWEFRRILCPGCGEETEQRLPVFSAGDSVRVECCDTCRTYIKTIDMTKDGHVEPMVDELASAPLDLWAQERGYAKLHRNLLGM